MTMGDRLRELRLKRGMTQEEVGKLVGVQRSTVQKWEGGHTRNLRTNVIERLSKFFQVSPAYLMGMDASDDSSPSLENPEIDDALGFDLNKLVDIQITIGGLKLKGKAKFTEVARR